MKHLVAGSALLLASTSIVSATEGRVRYSATAYALGSSDVLYVEKHVETLREGRLAERSVRYEDPRGRLIAEKVVRYGESPQAPSFEMTDFRIGVREGAEVDAGKVALYSGAAEEVDRVRTVERPDNAVVDAGFDAFMRENFARIADGRKLEFDFAVPAVGRFFKFQLVPEGRVEYESEPALMVKMKPANRLLRLLVDPIDLVYGLDGRLLEFRGLSNVFDEEGDRYKARIVFDYPNVKERPEVTVFEADSARPAR